jgi:hypothetical protein
MKSAGSIGMSIFSPAAEPGRQRRSVASVRIRPAAILDGGPGGSRQCNGLGSAGPIHF